MQTCAGQLETRTLCARTDFFCTNSTKARVLDRAESRSWSSAVGTDLSSMVDVGLFLRRDNLIVVIMSKCEALCSQGAAET